MGGRPEDYGLTLRPARADEADRLSDIARAAKAHWGYPAAWLTAWRDQLRVTPEDICRDRVVIAALSDTIVGFLALRADDGQMAIEHLWVDPPAMSAGVGRRLLEDAFTWCSSRGITRLQVVSDPHAAGFYRRCGASEIGDVPSTPAPRRLPLLEFALRPDGAPVAD
jgi:GNAT superfamily N-acetyltransferase